MTLRLTLRLASPLTLRNLGSLAELGRRLMPVLPQRERRVRVVDGLMLGPGNRLTVVAFGGRELLLSVTKTGATLVAEDAR